MKTILVALALAILTIVYPRWIEATTGIDPDAGSGLVEVALVVGLVVVAILRAAILVGRRSARRPVGR